MRAAMTSARPTSTGLARRLVDDHLGCPQDPIVFAFGERNPLACILCRRKYRLHAGAGLVHEARHALPVVFQVGERSGGDSAVHGGLCHGGSNSFDQTWIEWRCRYGSARHQFRRWHRKRRRKIFRSRYAPDFCKTSNEAVSWKISRQQKRLSAAASKDSPLPKNLRPYSRSIWSCRRRSAAGFDAPPPTKSTEGDNGADTRDPRHRGQNPRHRTGQISRCHGARCEGGLL